MTIARPGILRCSRPTALLLGAVLAAQLHAGDEDMSPSPYQEFDPVTGYMVTVDPAKQQHEQAAQGDAKAGGTADAPAEEPAPRRSSLVFVLGGLAVVVIIAAGARRRRARRSP